MKIATAAGAAWLARKEGHINPLPLPGAGLLVLRLVVGVTFLLHGIDKLGDLSGTERLFASLDIPRPASWRP